MDALFQTAIEMAVAANIRGPEEQASTERRARDVAAHLDEVAAALERAHLTEDDDERHSLDRSDAIASLTFVDRFRLCGGLSIGARPNVAEHRDG